jgi:BirA family transcriptional regulator, biotin operon repressor / biotin---[acetyl-CoA-carboxylase] ligase
MQQPVKYFYKRLNSTNLRVSQMVNELSGPQPFWVRTDDQYAGKGQGNNIWISEAGQNLTGTLAIYPSRFEASRQFALSQVFALASTVFLELFIDEIRIKWPNDLYADDRKIGGILIETAILGPFINYAILGIGLNINQQKFTDSIPNPVSISMLTGMTYDLEELEDLFLEAFRNKFALIESGCFEELNSQYVNRLYRIGELCSFKTSKKTFEARITGVNEYGHLLLQTPSGSIRSYAYQEVEYIIPPTPSTSFS